MPHSPQVMPQPTQEPEAPGPGEEEEEEEEEEQEPAANAAPVVPTPLAPAPARKRGRPRGKPTGTGLAPSTEHSDEWPIQAVEVWDRIVHDVLPKMECTPQNVYCLVYRFGMGAYSAQGDPTKDQMYVARIEGPSIGGTPSQSPGEALTDYMEMVVHPQASGPARYQLLFNWLRGGGIKMGHMSLPHPTEIARRRAFAGEYAIRQQMSGGVDPMMGPPAMPRTGYGQPPQPYPQPQYYPQPPQYYPSPMPQDSGEVAAMRRDLATVLGRFDEIARRDAEARGQPAPPPIAPQVAPPPVESEDVRLARLIDAALERRGVGSKPVGVGATPATATASIVDRMNTGLGELVEFAEMFKKFDKVRKTVFGVGAAEEEAAEIPPPTIEDPNAPAFGVRPIPFSNYQGKPVMWPKPTIDQEGNEVEESILSRVMKFAAANPDLSLAALERASKVLSQGAFAQLLQSFTAQGGQAAQAAATMADRVANGVGSVPPGTGYPSP